MIDERFGKIKGLSEKRRLPLLGKIRLGIKKKSATSGKEYPAETDYFVCPPEVQKIYGEKPKELEIMLPTAQKHIIFPTAYRLYGSSRGLKCIGNGEIARRFSEDKKAIEEIECPCEKCGNECKQRAFLMAILPKINMGGVYQISTGAYNSIVDINSGLDYVEALIGRIQMIPLKLVRDPIETHFDGKKQKHFTLKLLFNGDINFINQLRENTKRILLECEKIALPVPKDEDPAGDEPDEIINEETGEMIKGNEPDNFALDNKITNVQKKALQNLYNNLKLTPTTFKNKITKLFKKTDIDNLTHDEASEFIDNLSKEVQDIVGE